MADHYARFLREWGVEAVLMESPVFSRGHRYAGTLDLLARVRSLGLVLLDVKTNRSGSFPELALQLAAYGRAEFHLDDAGGEVTMPRPDAYAVLAVGPDGHQMRPVDVGEPGLPCRRAGRWLAGRPGPAGARRGAGAAARAGCGRGGVPMSTDLAPRSRRRKADQAADGRARPARLDVGAFNATQTDRPLWATVHGHLTIWIRWTEAHEEWVEWEQAITSGNFSVGVTVVGRIVRCGRYGEWYVGDWRPRCATCQGSGQVLLSVCEEPHRTGFIEVLEDTMDGGLYYLVEAVVECPDCLAHPGWVVG